MKWFKAFRRLKPSVEKMEAFRRLKPSVPGILLLIFIGLSYCGYAQEEAKTLSDGYQVFYYPNGNKSSEGTMRNGKPDGYWKTYNEAGKLVSEGNRKDFELDSAWKFYDENGKKALEINYLKGKKEGIRKTWREDEIIEEMFKNDIKNGLTRYLYPDGKLKKEVNFREGLEEGMSKEFDTDGRVITIITYKSGFITGREIINRYDNTGRKHGPWKYFYDDGTLRMEGSYKHGMENGYFKEYDRNGNLLTTSKFADGVKQENVAELVKLEVRKDYYPDGKIKVAATYNKEGKPEGIRREYAEDGTVEKSYIFRNGIMIGEGVVTEKGERDGFWKEYYDDGKLRAQGKYNKDLKEGPWVFYHPNGQTEQEGSYFKGKPEGEWRWYYAGGQLLREETCFNGLADGDMKEYDEAGNIITRGKYIEGREDGDWYYKVGDNETEGSYTDGMRNGMWRYRDLSPDGKQGTLRFEGRYIEDNPHGKHTYYWENGMKKEEGEYVNGRKEGDWIIYNPDGTPFIVVSYSDGAEVRFDGIQVSGTRPDEN
ncbi:MAG TPA: toxin-antitoxin system YwqK family antitoxin [Bacteroidales bacterium]|nr:toxin-antitoxin system YwqK family antitoxin [Bacteroidales bacterium]HPI86910.1 toxin-antitoxin system YwqK family antitoxin [Bacteroidales bacterium]HPM93111.1 toxin-antitoxin system YwqK family antitoxin [Bacteroidales bacterium]